MGKDLWLHILLWLVLGNIHCELKIDKQGLQDGKS